MEELNNISRLQEEQQKTLENCEVMIEKWEKFQEDYIAVDNLLNELPKKTTHEVMVPIGPLAFMPGNLIHTNEIMVLLGDNWFAERSATQAVEIAKRRLKNVEDYLKNLREERENILSHIAFTTDLASVKNQTGFKEIKEELTEKDKKRLDQKTRRIAHSRATKDSVKKVDLRTVSDPDTSRKCMKDEDLFARLKELERQERINNEMGDGNVTVREKACSFHEQNPNTAIGKNSSKTVKWKERLAEEKEADIVAFPKNEKATITFTHSSGKCSKLTPMNQNDTKSISSPADIFVDYLTKKASTAANSQHGTERQQPRSILKHSNNNERKDEILAKQELSDPKKLANDSSSTTRKQSAVPKAEVAPAFADVVVEHEHVPNFDNSATKEHKQETRKISKFKAGRMKNNNE